MPDMTYPIVITVLVVYALVLLLLNKANILSKANIEVIFGVLLMWRTTRGKVFINWLAKARRWWTWWGNLSLVVVISFSIGTFILLCWEAIIVVQIPPSMAPGPEMLIGIPGLNPIIPLGYGIVALAIAILIHEFSHGILTRVAKVKIRALGIIAILIPIGAFVEPDEPQLSAVQKRKRARVYAAGPMANISFAFVCAIIFSMGFMGSVEPVKDGVVITKVTVDYPAEEAGLRPWMLITSISSTNFTVDHMVSDSDFSDAMARTRAGDVVTITYFFKGRTNSVQATLVDKYDYYKKYYPEAEFEDDIAKFKGVGFLGINTMSLREDVIEAQAHPFGPADTPLEMFGYGLVYVSLPLLKMSPMPPELTDLLVISGPMGAIPSEAFWMLTNLFYWLFWLNFMVGATNVLPARPLDGGHIFKDSLIKMMEKMSPATPKKRMEKLADRTSWAMSLVVLFLIIWLVAGPYVSAGVRGLIGG